MTVNSAIKTAIELKKQPNGDVYFYERQAFFDPLTGLLQKQNRQLIGVQKEAAAEVISVCTRYGQPKGSKLHLLLDEHNRIRDLIPVGLAPAAFSESDQAQVRAVRAQAQVQDTIAASQQLQPSLITADKVKAGRTVPAYGQVNDEPHLAPYRWSYYHQGQEIAFIPQEIPIPTANTVNDNFAASADDAKYQPQFYSVTASVSPSLLSTPVKAALLPADKKIDRAWLPRNRTRAFVQEQEQAVAKAQAQAQKALAEAQALSQTSLYPDAVCAHPAAKVNPIYAGLRATTVAYAANNAPAQLPAARSARHTALALPQGADALSVGQYGFTNLSSIYEPRVGASWQQICAPYQGFAPRALKAAPQIKLSPLARALFSTSTTGLTLADRAATGNSSPNARGTTRKVLPSFKDFSTPQDWDSTSFISASRFNPQAQKVPVTPRSATHISTKQTLQELWHSLNGQGKGNARQLYFPPLPQPEASMAMGSSALLPAPPASGAQRASIANAAGYGAAYGATKSALLPPSRVSAQGNEVDEAYSDNTVITSAVDGVYQQQTTHHTPEQAHPELYDRNTITTYHHAPPAPATATAATATTPETAPAQGAASTASADSKDSADQGTAPPQPNTAPAVTVTATDKDAQGQQPTPTQVSDMAADKAAAALSTDKRPDTAAAQVSSSSQPAQNSGATMTNQHSTGPTVAEAMAAAAAAPQPSEQNTPAMPRANHLQGAPAPFNAPANVPLHSNGSRTQTQAQAQSQAPLPSQRRSTVGNKPAPVSAQTRAQAQAYIASLQAHANKAVMAVKAAQQIARAKFGDTYEIPPYDDPISTGTSMLEHLQLPNVNTRLYEDPNYIPSDSAIAFADQHAPYHQAFSHATSVSSYAYGAEFAEQATQGKRTPSLTAVTTADYQKRSAAEYQQRARALQDQGSANIIPMTAAPVAAPAPQQATAMSAQTAIIDNRNRVNPLPPINAATAMAHSIGADTTQNVSTTHHNLGTGRLNEEADRAEGSGYNTALGQSSARQFIPEHTPWWRDQAVTEQSAQEAFAADNFHQLQQGAFIGTPEEFLPEEKPQPAPTPTAPVYQRRSFIPATNNDTTIISVPAAQEHLERNLTKDAYPLPESALDAGSVMATEYDAAVQAEAQETASQALSTSAHEALTATRHEPATLVSTPQGMISPADLVNSAATESEEIAVSTITVGQSSLAPALLQEQEQSAKRVKVKPQSNVGNTAIERRPLPPQPQIDRTFADFVTANGKKGTDDAVAAAAAAAARKGEFASRLDPTAPQHVADAVAVKSSTATAISSTSPDLAAALARQEPQEVEDVPAHPTAIAVTPSAATAPAASAATGSDESEGGYDFSDFKTADGSTVSGDYKIRVVSQKQLQAQRENEAALAKQAQEQAEKERKAAAQAQTEKLFDALQKAAMMESLAAHNAAECARELASLQAKQEQQAQELAQQEEQQMSAELEAAPEQTQEQAPDAAETAPSVAAEPQAPDAEPVATAADAAEPPADAIVTATAVTESEQVSAPDASVESTPALEQASATVAATAADTEEIAASAATTAEAEAPVQPSAAAAPAAEVTAESAAAVTAPVSDGSATPYSSAEVEPETEAAAEAASAAAPSAENQTATATAADVSAAEASAPTAAAVSETTATAAIAQSAARTEEDELADLETALSQGKISKSQYKRLKRKFKPRPAEGDASATAATAATATAAVVAATDAAPVESASAATVATETETARESTAATPSIDQDAVSASEAVASSDDSTVGTSAFLATDSASETAESSAAVGAESTVSDTTLTDAVPLSTTADADADTASVSAAPDEESSAAASPEITAAAATEDTATASAAAEEMTGSSAYATNPASAPDGFLAAEAMLSATAMAADNSSSVLEVAESSTLADSAAPETESEAVAEQVTPDTAESEAEITAVAATVTEETVSTDAPSSAASKESADTAAPAAPSPAQDSHSSTTLSSGEKSLRAVQQAADLRRDADLSMEASLNLVLAASAEQAQQEEEHSAADETVSDSASDTIPPSGERVVIIPEPQAEESAPEPEVTALSANTIVTAQAVSSAQEQAEGEQSLADKLKLSPHTAVEQHEATAETVANDTAAEATAAETENDSAPATSADTSSEVESSADVTAADSVAEDETKAENEVATPATAETAPADNQEDATEVTSEATVATEPEQEAQERAEAAAEATAAEPDDDTAHRAAPASTAPEDAAPAAAQNTSAQEPETASSASAEAAPELHLDLNATLQPAVAPLPPQIPEQTVMVRAQYTHPSFEELSATIRGDSSNQPLNYNAIDVISPAYKAKDDATADILARSGSGTEEPQAQPNVKEQHKAEVPQDVVFATPKRFISSGANNGLLNAEHGAQDNSGEGVKAMQEAVADVVATSLNADSDEELLEHSGITDEDATLAYLQATTSANPQHSAKTKNNNSLASLAAELIDDFDDPFEDSFSEGLSEDEGQMRPSVRRSKGAKDSDQQ